PVRRHNPGHAGPDLGHGPYPTKLLTRSSIVRRGTSRRCPCASPCSPFIDAPREVLSEGGAGAGCLLLAAPGGAWTGSPARPASSSVTSSSRHGSSPITEPRQ